MSRLTLDDYRAQDRRKREERLEAKRLRLYCLAWDGPTVYGNASTGRVGLSSQCGFRRVTFMLDGLPVCGKHAFGSHEWEDEIV